MKYVFTAVIALVIGVFGTRFWPTAAAQVMPIPKATCTTDAVPTCTVPISMLPVSTSAQCAYMLDFELLLAKGVTKATIVWNITPTSGNYKFAEGGNAVTILNGAGNFTSPTQPASPQSFQYTFAFPGPGVPTPGTTYAYNLSIVDTVVGAACTVKSQPPQPYPRIKNE